jgi:hypothetical protein
VAGLALNVGGYGAARGSVPTAANQPSGTTVNQAAFGITSGDDGTGPALAGFGTVGLGLAGALLIAWFWWTLPR